MARKRRAAEEIVAKLAGCSSRGAFRIRARLRDRDLENENSLRV